MKKVSMILAVAMFSVVFAACTHQTPAETTPAAQASPSTAPSMAAAASPAADAQGIAVGEPNGADGATGEAMDKKVAVRKITVDSFKFGYSTKQIDVKAGETIELTLTNSDGMHDLVIDELNVKTKQIQKGQSDTVTFTIPEDAKGKTFEYYCSVMNHRQMGQVGKLVVN
jgi:plastocyanin